MAIKDSAQTKIGRNIGIAWTLVAYVGALAIGWIGIGLFGPNALADREFVMPLVMLKIFPPVVAAILITGAIAAMISTADSLLILSSTELSENILKPLKKKKVDGISDLARSRMVTAVLAAIALLLAYVSPSKLIFTIVGYVWAGVGGTFSIVILFTLFWKKFHGKAALITIVTGMLFTIIWISAGLDAKVITARFMTFFVAGIMASISTFVFKPQVKG